MQVDVAPPPGADSATQAELAIRARTLRVVLLYRRHQMADEHVLHLLEKHLAADGYEVFIDRHVTFGMDWVKEIEGQLRNADVVVPLISESSIHSEMMEYELASADAAAREQGRPRLLPIRLKYSGPLPHLMAEILEPLPCIRWEGLDDDTAVVREVFQVLKSLLPGKSTVRIAVSRGFRSAPRAAAGSPANDSNTVAAALLSEQVGGAVALNSDFYLVRPADAEIRNAMARYDSIILIKGARQMGKTSLLARGLQFARERGAKVALSDLQKLNQSDLQTVGGFYLALSESLADQLGIPDDPRDDWDEKRGPNVNFERYVRRHILAKLNAPLVWALDEVDRLFVSQFGSEVFGLFRSWHNERALDPGGPWAGLTLAISYATEAHLFISDMNQSPFNVGTRVTLEDFSPSQVSELNRRHGSPLKNEEEEKQFVRLVGGHPFLVRRALHEMAVQSIGLEALAAQLDLDGGIFGDHLRRNLVLLGKDLALTEAVREVLRGKRPISHEDFYRLRSAGLMAGIGPADVRLRCELYLRFLTRHLL